MPSYKDVRRKGTKSQAFRPGKNHLLLIAIDAYQACGKLNNAVRDAEVLRDLLHEHYCFEPAHTYSYFNEQADRKGLMAALRKMIDSTHEDDSLILYFSGHGHFDEVLKEGYWVPQDASYELIDDYIPYSFVQKVAKAIPARHVLLIVDSCYSGAVLGRDKNMPTDRLERDPSRWLIASGRNEVVPDGIAGYHSPFAEELIDLLKNYRDRGLTTQSLVAKLTVNVIYNANQTPIGEPMQDVGHKNGQFIFHPKQGPFQPDIEPLDSVQLPGSRPSETSLAWSYEMVPVEGNGFSFQIGKYLVTQKDWKTVMGNSPSAFKGIPSLPVESVSWDDVQVFIQKLNRLTGENYRLPWVTEWEFAAQGGSASQKYAFAGSNSLDDCGWYWENAQKKTQAVGQKQPNELGLYDMSGNVWEWCEDPWQKNDKRRIIIGGSWQHVEKYCRPAENVNELARMKKNYIGFRLVKDN